ncbi:MAG: hypothetical protein E7662_13350 [Ruminococcaceae bacterium]|nr:hypothetical protein [Oscillospiraceae bacterium]
MKAEIKNYNGRPAIMINGAVYPPMMATIRTNARDHIEFDREYFSELGKAGIKIFFLICDTIWLKPNALQLFEDEARALLAAVPDAWIVPRIGMHPTNEWIEAHPAETLTYSDGSRPPVHLFTESYETDLPAHYSLCSDQWRHDAGEALRETWSALMQLPYADRIIGCFLAAGGTSEWYYMHQVYKDGRALDHSDAFRRAFSAYLTEKFGTDDNLRRAWRRDDVTLDNPPIPAPECHFYEKLVDAEVFQPKQKMLSNADVPPPPQNGTNIGSFIDIDAHMDVFDFWRAWHLGTADSVLHFARIIKEMTPERLVGAFYGSVRNPTFFDGGTCGGTLRILDSGAVDFLAAPGVYENRHPGGFTGQREMHDSFALRNRIYIVEDDERTHLENRYFQDKYNLYDITDSVNILKREFGRNICEETQAWWFDQLLGGRRFKDPDIYNLFAAQQKIAAQSYEKDRRKNSEIAFIYDQESIQCVSQQTTRDLIEEMRNYTIARIGAPVDQYYHDDMANPAMPAYKLYVFFNLFYVTKEERRIIREKLQREGATAVWMYASGVIDPDAEKRFDPANMKSLTGMDMEMLEGCWEAKLRVTEHPLTAKLDKREILGANFALLKRVCAPSTNEGGKGTYLYPLFYSRDGEVAANFLTSGVPAITVKKLDGYTSIFYGAKCIEGKILRAMAEYAGCHIYTDSEEVLFANRNYVTFHASFSGTKTLRLPRRCTVREVYEDKIYATDADSVTFDAYLGETKMFELTD